VLGPADRAPAGRSQGARALRFVETAQFVAGMRQLAAGVTLVTTALDGARAGLTATAVCSVSAEPPQLLACVNREAEAHSLLLASGRLAVNLLSAGQRGLADRFSGRTGVNGEARFGAGRWTTMVTGAPILEDAPASFDCEIVTAHEAGTHTIFIARVLAVAVRPGLSPVVYLDGLYGRIEPLPPGPGPEA
jgi:flavin reductase (DIM6/NTAB) family NADH-FMN oxidoreductase RutF